jgi:LemA protein
MKKFILFLLGTASIFSMSSCSYNSLVSLDEQVKTQWAQVENAYKRRADLIPNLVNTVKGAANFEQKTLTDVIEARSKATQIKVDPANLTPEKLKQYQDAQGQLGSALGRLLSVTENYPQLRATESFKELQSQLEGTENRISVEREKFNSFTKDYNTKVRSFPSNISANMFGFKEKPYFQAPAGSDKAPTVAF